MPAAFIFRIIIGALFILEYFIGLDGHGRGAGSPLTLLFGCAFVAYGVYASIQRASLHKRILAARAQAANAGRSAQNS